MALDIYTGHLAKSRSYERSGLVVIDTTVKSGDKVFAPTWQIVMDVKKSIITPEEYTASYHQMMKYSYANNKEHWRDLLSSKEPIVICCYCAAGKFCHRHLLVDYLLKAAINFKISVNFKGEFKLEKSIEADKNDYDLFGFK